MVGKPDFNWEAPCLEQELIRWQHVMVDNFTVNNTDGKAKACLLRGWIGDKGLQLLYKYTWLDEEWWDFDTLLQRFKERIQPKGRNQCNKYKSELDHFRQTTETFTEFYTELKRKFELAKNKSTRCTTHKKCQACMDGYMEEELMSLIYT